MSIVFSILKKTLEISESLSLEHIVFVCDQALYSKVQEIRWREEGDFLNKIVVRLGEFHTCMSFLSIIGKRFSDAGLKDVMVDSGIIAEGSLSGVLSGHHYNRSVRSHKLICDAFLRLQFESYLESLSDQAKAGANDLCQKLKVSFPDTFYSTTQTEEFKNLIASFNDFIAKRCEVDVNFAFWNSYIDLVELLLTFIRATREGNWTLHISTLCLMLPWYFAYNKVHYSRYLPAYIYEMKNLETSCPEIYSHFLRGDFAVQRKHAGCFSMTACDQVIEQTLNRDSKTKGGMKGITLNRGAVNRWILSHAPRAAIRGKFLEMAGQRSKESRCEDLSENRKKIDEESVQKIIDTVKSFDNPFLCKESSSIVHLSSGLEADKETNACYLNAKKTGEEAVDEFCKERLVEKKLDFYDPIKLTKLKTFDDMVSRPKSKAKLTIQSAKEDKQLFKRLLLLAQEQKLDLVDLLSYPLSSVPPALGNFDGSLRKTNKSALFKCLEKLEPSCRVTFDNSFSDSTALLVDGMAFLHKQKPSETFADFASKLMRQLLAIAKAYGARRVDFVIDQYNKVSIKNSERSRRMTSANVIRLTRASQKMPSSLADFLCVSKNKEALFDLLLNEWENSWSDRDVSLFVSKKGECFMLSGSPNSKVSVPELSCDHEEADTRLFLHAHHAVLKNYKRILIYSPDTDVLVLACNFYFSLNVGLFILSASGLHLKLFDVGAIAAKLGRDCASALLGLHAFSGCDSVSSFFGKGKQKCFSSMMDCESSQEFFSALGSDWDVSSTLMSQCEYVVCQLYGWKGESDINSVRYNCFKMKTCADSALPPNKDSLLLHLKRANYQSRIWRLSLQTNIEAPNPENHGWTRHEDEDTTLKVVWSTMPIAPDELMEKTTCSCKKSGCKKMNCGCFKRNIKCSTICRCLNCENSYEVEEDMSDSEGIDLSHDYDDAE